MSTRPLPEIPQIPATSRRRFFIGAIYAIWAAIAIALNIPALIYLLLPPKARREDQWVEAGDVARLSPGVPVEMAFRRNRVDGWRVLSEKSTAWVVRQTDNSIVAFGPQCTHLGCAYHWEDKRGQFLCPCHTSLFNPDGNVAGGPASRPLDRYEVKVQGTKLLLGALHKSEES